MTLPFHFDTTSLLAKLVRGVLGLLLVLAVGTVYSLVARPPVVTLALLFTTACFAWVGRLAIRHSRGSKGTITSDAVILQPVRVYGVRLTAATGTFPIDRFTAVRVEHVSASIEGDAFARVYLIGREATPDVLIATGDPQEGLALARGLAGTFALPIEEGSTPY